MILVLSYVEREAGLLVRFEELGQLAVLGLWHLFQVLLGGLGVFAKDGVLELDHRHQESVGVDV